MNEHSNWLAPAIERKLYLFIWFAFFSFVIFIVSVFHISIYMLCFFSSSNYVWVCVRWMFFCFSLDFWVSNIFIFNVVYYANQNGYLSTNWMVGQCIICVCSIRLSNLLTRWHLRIVIQSLFFCIWWWRQKDEWQRERERESRNKNAHA